MTQTWWLERKIRNLVRKFSKANFAYTILKYSDLDRTWRRTSVRSLPLFSKVIFIGVSLLFNVVLLSTVQQNESAIHIHISLLSFGLPPHSGCHSPLSRVPYTIQYVLIIYNIIILLSIRYLVIYFIHIVNSIYALIPVSQLLPSPCPLGFPCGSAVMKSSTVQELQKIWILSLGREGPLEEGMATHFSIAWRIPWTEKPGKATVHRFTKSWTLLKQLSTQCPCPFRESESCSITSNSLPPCGL